MPKYPHFKPTEKLRKDIREVRTASHATYNINYHLIWIPNQPDHIHLFLSAPPVWSPSEIVNILTQANWLGIPVAKINERGTSHTCSKCGSKGTRPYQGLFRCPECGYECNADFNGAKNIKKRFLEQSSLNGAVLQPISVLETQALKYVKQNRLETIIRMRP